MPQSQTRLVPDFDAWNAAKHSLNGPHGTIAWWREGEGRPLLLIHGFPTASLDWAKVWPGLLASGRQLIALDMLGFGFSDKPARRYDLIEQADLQVTLLSHLGVQSCDILTHDYGVSVTQELLARQDEGKLPVGIDKVVFLNGGLFPDQHRARLIQNLLNSPLGGLVSQGVNRRAFARSFSAVFGPDTQPDSPEIDLFWAVLSHKNGHRRGHRLIRYIEDRKLHAGRWEAALGTQTARIAMINGSLDPVSGRHLADRFAQLFPSAPLTRLNVGHYPQWEDADGVLSAVLEFLGAA